MPIPLPDPTNLAAAATQMEQQLASFEARLADMRFTASGSGIGAVADGLVDLVTVTIAQSLLDAEARIRAGGAPPAGPRLADQLKTVTDAALAAAKTGVQSSVATFGSGLSLPGIPAAGRPPPDFDGFLGTVTHVGAKQATFESRLPGRSAVAGPVIVTVTGDLKIGGVTLDVLTELPASATELAELVLLAINSALGAAKTLVATDLGRAHDLVCDNVRLSDSRTISVSIPSALSPEDVALGSAGALTTGSNAEIVKTSGGFATITNTGSSDTTLGGRAKVGDIWSQGQVILGANTRVNGRIRSPAAVVKPSSATVTGGIIQEPVTAALTSWQVGFPLTSGGNLVLSSGQQVHRNPGRFGSVTLGPSSDLFLRTGTYYFDSLVVGSGARLHLDMSAGAINMYVLNQVVWSGSAIRDAGEEANLLLGHFGSSSIALSTPLPGTLVAPNAEIALGSLASSNEYVGAIFSKKITFGSAKFRHVAYKEWALLTA